MKNEDSGDDDQDQFGAHEDKGADKADAYMDEDGTAAG